MAENPASWKRAELVILDALEDHAKMTAAGACGLSTPATIAWRLRDAGLINDQDESEIGWDKLRAHRAERRGEPAPKLVERRSEPRPFASAGPFASLPWTGGTPKELTDTEAAIEEATWD